MPGDFGRTASFRAAANLPWCQALSRVFDGTARALRGFVTDTGAAPAISIDVRARALATGIEQLSDADLLSLVLRHRSGEKSALGVAARLLADHGGLAALARLGPYGLAMEWGIGEALGTRLAAAFELGRRASIQALGEERRTVGCFESVVAWARPRLAALEREEVWLLALDGRNGLKSARRIAQGGLHGCALTPRDVLCPALRDAASAIVLVHNHPSGEPGPSSEDIQMTRAVAIACDVVGIPLLDHVIVARGGASSLLELGALPG
jgi:DNA repair protein RadC